MSHHFINLNRMRLLTLHILREALHEQLAEYEGYPDLKALIQLRIEELDKAIESHPDNPTLRTKKLPNVRKNSDLP